MCKILESIIKDYINDNLEIYGLTRNSKHGFMYRKSCTTNLFTLLKVLTKQSDSKTAMDVVYLNFAKAFDKVPHFRLISKLWNIW